MQVLFLSDNFPPEVNACASRVYERACYWVKWGHQVTVITCAPNFPDGQVFPGYKNKWYQEECMDGIRVIRVKTYITKNAGFIKRVLDFLSFMFMAIIVGLWQKKPDVIVATSPQFFTAVGGWFLSLLKMKPFVFELSDLWPASIKAVGAMKQSILITWLEKLELFLYRRAKRIIVLSPAFKTDLINRQIPADKIDVVINGVDLQRFPCQAKDPALLDKYNLHNKFVIGYIGTHGMAHDLSNVLLAAEQLHENIVVVFVGSGAEKPQLMQMAQTKQLNNVIFIDRQSKEDIPKYWALCDLALVHLKNDPVFESVIPSKIFEAMAMQLPILLAAPQGQATDIIEKEKVGLCVEAGDPAALALAINDLYQSPALLQGFKGNSQHARQQYSREEQAKLFLESLSA